MRPSELELKGDPAVAVPAPEKQEPASEGGGPVAQQAEEKEVGRARQTMHAIEESSGAGGQCDISIKVTITLDFYATAEWGPFLKRTGASMPSQYIKFNVDGAHQDARAPGFAVIAQMLQVHGVIDGMHVALGVQAHDRPVFTNQKGFHSMNMQLACDHKLCTMHVCAQCPGSVHTFFMPYSTVPGLFEASPPWLGGLAPGGQGLSAVVVADDADKEASLGRGDHYYDAKEHDRAVLWHPEDAVQVPELDIYEENKARTCPMRRM